MIHQGDYKALSNFYREKVFSQFPLLSGICFDVLDAMNATQVLKDYLSHFNQLFVEGVGKWAFPMWSKDGK